MKKLLIVILAASLGGCATQFGTRIAHPFHHHRIITKAPIAPTVVAPAPPPVIAVPVPVPAPERPKSFLQRHAIKWLH